MTTSIPAWNDERIRCQQQMSCLSPRHKLEREGPQKQTKRVDGGWHSNTLPVLGQALSKDMFRRLDLRFVPGRFRAMSKENSISSHWNCRFFVSSLTFLLVVITRHHQVGFGQNLQEVHPTSLPDVSKPSGNSNTKGKPTSNILETKHIRTTENIK